MAVPQVRSALPKTLHLPSGKLAQVVGAPPADEPSGDLYARSLAVLDGRIELSTGRLDDLALRDLHTLAACLLRAGWITEPELNLRCDNCGTERLVQAASTFEWGPLCDGELDDLELDAAYDWTRTLRLPVRVRREPEVRAFARLRLRAVTVADLRPLVSSTRRDLSVRPLTLQLLTSLGVEPCSPARARDLIAGIARLGARGASRLSALWLDAHVPPRLSASHRCEECGAVNVTQVPHATAIDWLTGPAESPPLERPPDFPSPEEFARLVRAAKRRVFADRRVRGLRVIVDDGIPAVDDGGNPLLGSYVPHGDPLDSPAVVHVYLRTFEAEKRLDPTFDVTREIFETVDHEVEHHLAFLRGEDPVDEEERLALAKDRERVVGRRELERREGVGAEVPRALRALAPLLLVVVGVFLLRHCS
jgi:hypothetical protein